MNKEKAIHLPESRDGRKFVVDTALQVIATAMVIRYSLFRSLEISLYLFLSCYSLEVSMLFLLVIT